MVGRLPLRQRHAECRGARRTTGSKAVLATTSAERQLIPRFRTKCCSAEVVSSVPRTEVGLARRPTHRHTRSESCSHQ